MSAAAMLTRPEVATWPTFQPQAPRPRNANTKPTPASAATYYNMLANDGAGANGESGVTTGNSELDALFAYLIADAALRDVASESDDSPNLNQTGMMMPVIFGAVLASAQSSGTGDTGTGAIGNSNVGAIGGGNPAGIAQGVLGQSAAHIMASQSLPMAQGIPTDVCCANFVSACLQKAGLLPASAHTNGVAELKSTLQNRGWRTVSRSEAKPGDVCIIGGSQHVEIVAKNENGTITLIGSNNTEGGSGPQVVSYDGSSGNRGNVQFLSPP